MLWGDCRTVTIESHVSPLLCRWPTTMRTLLVRPLVVLVCMVTMALPQPSLAASLRASPVSSSLSLFIFLSPAIQERKGDKMIDSPSFSKYLLCLALTYPPHFPSGLSRSTHSSSGADIKREDKEDDENSSVADKSEDEKKDSKARTRTRWLSPSVCSNDTLKWLKSATLLRCKYRTSMFRQVVVNAWFTWKFTLRARLS